MPRVLSPLVSHRQTRALLEWGPGPSVVNAVNRGLRGFLRGFGS